MQTQMTKNRIISLYGNQKEWKRHLSVQRKRKQWGGEALWRDGVKGRSRAFPSRLWEVRVWLFWRALKPRRLVTRHWSQVEREISHFSVKRWPPTALLLSLPYKNTSLTSHHCSEGNQFLYPQLTSQQFLFIPKLLALYKHTATPITVEVFSCSANLPKTVPFSICSVIFKTHLDFDPLQLQHFLQNHCAEIIISC